MLSKASSSSLDGRGREGRGGGGVEEKGREERRLCWNGHKHVLKAHMSSKHSYT